MRISEMVKAMWDTLGIRTTLSVMEPLAWIDRMKTLNVDIGFWAGGRAVDTNEMVSGWCCGAPGNWDSLVDIGIMRGVC